MLESPVSDAIGEQDLLRLSPDTSVAMAAQRMAERHVGAMLVCEGETMQGIFTERDLLERVVAAGRTPAATLLEEVMTPDPASIGPGDSLLQAIFAMKERRTRHLLVKRDGEVVGIVSVRDLFRALVQASIEERQRLDDLWEGFPV